MATTENEVQQRTQAIQKRQADMPFVARGWEDAYRQAQALAQSDLLPKDYRGKPANVLVAILAGARRGLDPLTSLLELYVVEGRPSMSVTLAHSLVLDSGLCAMLPEVVEWNEQRVTYRVMRRGKTKPEDYTYSMKDAEREGLATRDGWKKRPKDMMGKRALGRLLRLEFPDVLTGLALNEAEADGERRMDYEVSAIPETRPVDVMPPAALPEPQPARTLERAPEAEPVPAEVAASDVTRGQDVPQETEAGPMEEVEKRAVAIIEGTEADDLTPEQLAKLIDRAAELKLPEGDALRKELVSAFKAAQKRLKAKGA